MYQGRKPTSDDTYFENMARVIFLAGLNWKMIDEKWPNFQKAFENFSVDQVARFDDGDVKRLMSDAGIVKNRAKIVAVINNAKQLQNIRKECGSFKAYLDGFDKSDNYALVIKELGKKFKRLGPSSAKTFLFSVGETIRIPEM